MTERTFKIIGSKVVVNGRTVEPTSPLQGLYDYMMDSDWHHPEDCEIDEWTARSLGYVHEYDIVHDETDCPYVGFVEGGPHLTAAINALHLEHDPKFPRRFCQHPVCHSFTGSILDKDSSRL